MPTCPSRKDTLGFDKQYGSKERQRMKYLIVKRNFTGDPFNNLSEESLTKGYKNSILNHSKDSSEWTECDAIAFTATQYFGQVLDCFEVDDKDCTFLSIKYSEIIYRTIDKKLDQDLYEKMKTLGFMNSKVKELDEAMYSLNEIESELYNSFEEITGSEPYVSGLGDLSSDEYVREYTIVNDSIKELFEEFFD